MTISSKPHIVNQGLMCMEEFYHTNGKLGTKLTETRGIIFVDMAPLTVLNDCIRSMGFHLNSAQATAKWKMDENQLCPFMVIPNHNLYIFPHRLTKHGIVIWLNAAQIKWTSNFNRKTKIEFENGKFLMVEGKVSDFNKKLQFAEQLRKRTVEMDEDLLSFTTTPNKKQMHFRKNRKKE